MDETTTETPVESGAVQEAPVVAQPVEGGQVEAVENETANQEQPVTETEQDDDVTKFAKSKGLELDSESTRKAVKMAMEAEKRMHQATSKAGELEKTMIDMSNSSADVQAQATGADPQLLRSIQAMETKLAIRDFFEATPDARQYEEQMKELALTAGIYGTPETILKATYAMAKASDTSSASKAKSEAKQEALQNLAQKQQASTPVGNAVNPSVSSAKKDFSSLSISEMEKQLGYHKL